MNGDFFKDLDQCENPFSLNDDYGGITLAEPERISPITSLSEPEFHGFIDGSVKNKHDVTEYVNYVTNEQMKFNEGNGGALSDSGMSSDNNMDM